MIKRLRFRFIAVALIAMMLVLGTTVATINIIIYHQTYSQADAVLSLLAKNNGEFPEETDEAYNHHGMDRETPFESRYFSVTLTKSGDASDIDTENIATVSKTKAVRYARIIRKLKRTKGFLRDYRFLAVKDSSGNTTVYFIDCTKSMQNFRTFLHYSILISFIGISVVILLIYLLSKMAMKPVYEGYRRQRQFITDAGHEIKTPLTVINADLAILELESGENEWCDDIHKQVERLTELTNRLIKLSKLEEGAAPEEGAWTDVALSDSVKEMAESFRSRAKVEKKEFSMDISPGIVYFGDEGALTELTSILLDNALKYSPVGGKISVSLKRRRRDMVLSVTNTTNPMNTGDLDKLFDRFYRDDASRNDKTGGYGIGLSIAKATTEMHNGKISAVSGDDGRSLTITAVLRPVPRPHS